MTLVSNAVALDLLNEKLAVKDLYNDTLQHWKEAFERIIDDFQKQINRCKRNFETLSIKDFENINDAKELFDNNQLKYPHKISDVLFLGGSYCLRTLKNYTKILKKKDDKGTTIAIFPDDENIASFPEERFERILSKTSFLNCVKDTEILISLFDVLSYDLVMSLIYPEKQESEFQILLDTNTTANVSMIQDGSSTPYWTIVYIKKQKYGIRSTLHDTDYDVVMYEKQVETYGSHDSALYVEIIVPCAVVVVGIVGTAFFAYKCYKRRQANATPAPEPPIERNIVVRFGRAVKSKFSK
ncbi:uncharacterized protein LOC128555375 [Mercenaria mercenaria]|uniref:uncharacterized protein LOC128555375 n=1 Tax=Mercenaria mercenaria TaxID=6596 RepID=UPI00234EAACA|nr:uncharacterized protein LOC128555375 [Mercenaria mercenaria]